MTMTSNVKGDFNRHKSLDGWEVVVRLSKQNLANQRHPHPRPTNQRPGGSSIKVTDTWILREEVTWENGGKVMAPDSAYLLGTPTLPLSHPAGGSGATDTRSHKQIMEIAI